LSTYASCKVIFFPQVTYLVTNTILVPVSSCIVGEVWSAISAVRRKFYNPASPVPMVQVGNSGDVGVAQFTDMRFTVVDVRQGSCHMRALRPSSCIYPDIVPPLLLRLIYIHSFTVTVPNL
jgi:hypothetical protein